ncbi:MAG: hypothetical protein ABR955_16725, partial [Verrucomicrobiota bacterium]
MPIFEKGWDQTREDRLRRQKQLGLVPANTELSRRNPGIKPWSELTGDQKKFYVRLQSAFAGFRDYTDEQVGRLTSFWRISTVSTSAPADPSRTILWAGPWPETRRSPITNRRLMAAALTIGGHPLAEGYQRQRASAQAANRG